MTYLRPAILLLTPLLILLHCVQAHCGTHSASPRITAVTVYPDRAMTARSASFTLKPGSHSLVLEKLPVLLQDDSVRVEGKGTATATIVGTEIRRTYVEQAPEQRVQDLDVEIQKIARAVGSVDARRNALIAQKGFIESVRVAWGDRISKELGLGKPAKAELEEALSFIGAGVSSVGEKMHDLDGESKQLMGKLDALKKQREQVIGSHRKEVKSVEVAVEVTGEGSLSLELTAVVPNAGWEPSYDLRLARDGAAAELVFHGQVHQQTGEDWENVDLALSTARPAVGGAPPELAPWRVGFYHPRPMPAYAPAMGQMKHGARAETTRDGAMALEAVREQASPAPFLTAHIAEEQSSLIFRIPRAADIPSDGALHRNVVAIERFPVTLEYLTVPKISPHAFLMSHIKNPAPYPLLPGKVNIFTGGNFIGSSMLSKVASGEKFQAFFGSDEQVTVKREELKRHKEGGMFGKSRVSYRYRIAVNNFRKDAATVVVRDQLPVPADEEIKVTLEDPSIKPDETREDGTLGWKLPVKPGEKRELTFGISVEYPKDKEVVGL